MESSIITFSCSHLKEAFFLSWFWNVMWKSTFLLVLFTQFSRWPSATRLPAPQRACENNACSVKNSPPREYHPNWSRKEAATCHCQAGCTVSLPVPKRRETCGKWSCGETSGVKNKQTQPPLLSGKVPINFELGIRTRIKQDEAYINKTTHPKGKIIFSEKRKVEQEGLRSAVNL